jgi:hypothetical protein
LEHQKPGEDLTKKYRGFKVVSDSTYLRRAAEVRLPEDSSDDESSDDSFTWSAVSSGSSSHTESSLSSEPIGAADDKSISSGPDAPIKNEDAPAVSDTHTSYSETANTDDDSFMVFDDSIKATVVEASAVPDSGKPTVTTINGIHITDEETAVLSISSKSSEVPVIDPSATLAPKEPTAASDDVHITRPVVEHETASAVTVPEEHTVISTVNAQLPVDGDIVTTDDMNTSCSEAPVARDGAAGTMDHTNAVDTPAAHMSESTEKDRTGAPSKTSTTNFITAVEQPADVRSLTVPLKIGTSIPQQSLPFFSGLLGSIRTSSTTNTTAEDEQRVSSEASPIDNAMDITVQEHQTEQSPMNVELETARSTEPMDLDNTTCENVQSGSSMDFDQATSAGSVSQVPALPLATQDQQGGMDDIRATEVSVVSPVATIPISRENVDMTDAPEMQATQVSIVPVAPSGDTIPADEPSTLEAVLNRTTTGEGLAVHYNQQPANFQHHVAFLFAEVVKNSSAQSTVPILTVVEKNFNEAIITLQHEFCHRDSRYLSAALNFYQAQLAQGKPQEWNKFAYHAQSAIHARELEPRDSHPQKKLYVERKAGLRTIDGWIWKSNQMRLVSGLPSLSWDEMRELALRLEDEIRQQSKDIMSYNQHINEEVRKIAASDDYLSTPDRGFIAFTTLSPSIQPSTSKPSADEAKVEPYFSNQLPGFMATLPIGGNIEYGAEIKEEARSLLDLVHRGVVDLYTHRLAHMFFVDLRDQEVQQIVLYSLSTKKWPGTDKASVEVATGKVRETLNDNNPNRMRDIESLIYWCAIAVASKSLTFVDHPCPLLRDHNVRKKKLKVFFGKLALRNLQIMRGDTVSRPMSWAEMKEQAEAADKVAVDFNYGQDVRKNMIKYEDKLGQIWEQELTVELVQEYIRAQIKKEEDEAVPLKFRSDGAQSVEKRKAFSKVEGKEKAEAEAKEKAAYEHGDAKRRRD